MTYTTNKTYTTYLTYALAVFAAAFFFAPRAHAAVLSRAPNNLGLVGAWSFNEGVGTKVGDSSGNNYYGSIGGATWATGKHGNSLSFDGSSDYVNLGDVNAMENLSSMSFGGWVKRNGAQPQSGFGVLMGKLHSSGSTQPSWMIFIKDSGARVRLNTDVSDSSSNFWEISNNFVSGEWHHVMVTWTSGGVPKIYFDGQVQTLSSSNGLLTGSIITSSDNVLFGSASSTASSFDYKGSADDLRVYNRALSASDVLNLYKSGQATRKMVSNQGLVGAWNFNEGVGTKAGDSSGNGNTASTTGATWVDGKHGKALDFNGTSNYASAGTSEILNMTGDFSASLWFKTPGQGLNNFGSLLSRGNANYYVGTPNKGWNIVSRNISGADAIWFQYSGASLDGNISWTGGNDNLWHHAIATRSGNLFSLYIDGVLKNSQTRAVGDMSTTGENLNIGRSRTSNYYKGSIDDVKIYNRALSAAEVSTLYKQGESKVNSSQNSRLTNGLVGLWSFNGPDVSWPTIYDRSGSGNNGTATNMSTTTSRVIGKVGQALSFDGSNDAVNTGSNFVGTNPASISAWVYPRSAGETSFGALISNQGIALNTYVTNKFVFTSNNNTNSASSATIFPARYNTWIHVVATRTNTGVANIYIDGVLSGSADQNSGTPTTGSTNIFIGNRSDGAQTFDGTIDEVRIYNRVLSADEVKQLYNMGR